MLVLEFTHAYKLEESLKGLIHTPTSRMDCAQRNSTKRERGFEGLRSRSGALETGQNISLYISLDFTNIIVLYHYYIVLST